ncbi:hypothetical protein [Sphingomonas sp.]|uniref:hypothetical protein n=1 Tax=Sphingomonas sp. TaxID=28214 RepID=UPI0025EDC08C|nr:hypothetical protein [Sphingomonas sp.]
MRMTFSPSFLFVALAMGIVAVPAAARPAQPHAAHRADTLQIKLNDRAKAIHEKLIAIRKAGRVSPAEAAAMTSKLAWVRADSAKYVKQQGFLSAGESASYNRALDEIEKKLG